MERLRDTAAASSHQMSVTMSRGAGWVPSPPDMTLRALGHMEEKAALYLQTHPFLLHPHTPSFSLVVAWLEQNLSVRLESELANFSRLPKHTKLLCISESVLTLQNGLACLQNTNRFQNAVQEPLPTILPLAPAPERNELTHSQLPPAAVTPGASHSPEVSRPDRVLPEM